MSIYDRPGLHITAIHDNVMSFQRKMILEIQLALVQRSFPTHQRIA